MCLPAWKHGKETVHRSSSTFHFADPTTRGPRPAATGEDGAGVFRPLHVSGVWVCDCRARAQQVSSSTAGYDGVMYDINLIHRVTSLVLGGIVVVAVRSRRSRRHYCRRHRSRPWSLPGTRCPYAGPGPRMYACASMCTSISASIHPSIKPSRSPKPRNLETTPPPLPPRRRAKPVRRNLVIPSSDAITDFRRKLQSCTFWELRADNCQMGLPGKKKLQSGGQ